MSRAIDTLRIFSRLKESFTEQQAQVVTETLSEIVDDKLATKRDLKELEAATKRDLKKLEAATKRDLKELELRLKTEIHKIKSEILKWVLSFLVIQTSALIALLIKLL